jgi:peroxiredoxin
VPGLDDLNRTKDEFTALGAEFFVVFPINVSQAVQLEEGLGFSYPIYADPDWELFNTMQTGFALGHPKRCWIVVDAEGIIQFVWRVPFERATGAMDIMMEHRYFEADDILQVIRDL